jgi:hypothetical protein
VQPNDAVSSVSMLKPVHASRRLRPSIRFGLLAALIVCSLLSVALVLTVVVRVGFDGY